MKILILDLENAYVTAGIWDLWGNGVGIDQILDSGKVLSYAFRWYGKKEIVFKKHTDRGFLDTVHAALDEADAVVTFNGKKHDIPLLNREFIKAGFGPPAPFKHIDLIETAKRIFKFPSNKMQHILRELGLEPKEEHEGFPLWIKVMRDDATAWKKMRSYNITDVKRTTDLYDTLLPWIVGHPNHNLYHSGDYPVCTNCGGHHLHSRGTAKTLTQLYHKFQCQDCGKWLRTRYTIIAQKKRENVLVEAV